MLQIVYVSTATQSQPIDIEAILKSSRRNNVRDGVTGMLYADSRRFLQVLEGGDAVVDAALARIEADPRHRAIVILSKRIIDAREFGEWDMAHAAPGHDADMLLERVRKMAAGASPSVRATFEGFAEARRAA